MNDIGLHLLHFYCTFFFLKKDQGKPLKPKFYRRFVDNVIGRRLKNMHDSLFENFNNYNEKIKFTIGTVQILEIPRYSNFFEHDITTTEVYCKANKIPVHFKSQIPKKVQKRCNKYRPISFM